MQSQLEEIAHDIFTELQLSKDKFPVFPVDPVHASALVSEEAGELVRAVMNRVYAPHKGTTQKEVKAEAIQVAAMAIRFLINIDEYDWKPCEQTEDSIE